MWITEKNQRIPFKYMKKTFRLFVEVSFFFQFGNNWSTLLLFETNILDVFKVEILIELNFWLGMYVVYNLKWSLYPKIDENQCLPFMVNFKQTNNATILTFAHIIHYCFTSI